MNHKHITAIVNYYKGMVYVHFNEIVNHAVINIYNEDEPAMRMAVKEIKVHNFSTIPLPDEKGKYHVHIRIHEEEINKTIIIP